MKSMSSLGPLIIDIPGTTLTTEDRERLAHPLVGGVILFTRNYENPKQIKSLIHALHQIKQPRLLIAVDHEGGRVQRWQEGFTRIPPMETLGILFDKEPAQALSQAYTYGQTIARELTAVGVDLNFGPVLDLDYAKQNDLENLRVLRGGRAFHDDPVKVTILAEAYIRGLNSAGMKAVGKHFPGHGGVIGDTHFMLPADVRSLTQLQNDLYPFKKLVQMRLLAGIMTAHIIYPAMNNAVATLSPFWMNTVLRQQLGFQGVTISDDISMHALNTIGDYPQRFRLALKAGCDMILLCNNLPAADLVLGCIDAYPQCTQKVHSLYSQ